ncbi:piggyBac transposable element-derived protein 4-like [Anastrepha obliqua]|uniref:piggyBac transposable element-derived protein 4-like n=1 Tax=Anastrepha obliqua TaxID=95512 RepID=UPI00240A1BE6|nr:piggyBac transposable element-derived protein 4-like [Anastrepha obliqua]
MQRSLTQREIEECLYEDLPSGPESEASSDEDEYLDTPEWPVSKSILDVCGADVQNIHEELFDDEDGIPLSNFVSQNNVVTSTTLQPPKWKMTFSMDIPGEFVESVGLADHIISLEDVTPLRLFRMFWTEDLVEVISFQTNLYATKEGKPFSPTSPSEIQTFLAINMVIGIKKLPSYKDYWSSAPDLRDSYISFCMPLNRFSWLLGCLHLNDNNLMPDYNKLYKVRPMLEILRRNFRNNYKPSESIAVDESMIKFKGGSSLKQYMPKKPIKRGYNKQVTRRKRDGSAVRIDCPLAVKKYNSNMNFVDKFDQLKACYSIDRKSQKW